MQIGIHETERGPTIIGTRITVFSIIDYLKLGWHHSLIAAELRISSSQVLAAMKYIEEHKDAVMAEYDEILERAAHYKNPPDVEAKLEIAHARLQAMLEDIRQQEAREASDARTNGRP